MRTILPGLLCSAALAPLLAIGCLNTIEPPIRPLPRVSGGVDPADGTSRSSLALRNALRSRSLLEPIAVTGALLGLFLACLPAARRQIFAYRWDRRQLRVLLRATERRAEFEERLSGELHQILRGLVTALIHREGAAGGRADQPSELPLLRAVLRAAVAGGRHSDQVPTNLTLRSLVSETLHGLASAGARQAVSIQNEIDEDWQAAGIDSPLLRVALEGLLEHANQHARPGDSLRVSCTRQPRAGVQITIAPVVPPGRLSEAVVAEVAAAESAKADEALRVAQLAARACGGELLVEPGVPRAALNVPLGILSVEFLNPIFSGA